MWYICLIFPSYIPVDTTRAGAGDVEFSVKEHNHKIPSKLVEKGPGLYRAYFMPKHPRGHLVFVSFSKEAVPGEILILSVLRLFVRPSVCP